MDGHKLLWHLDRLAAWQDGERIVPLHIDMGITTGCNMSCIYCYGAIQGRDRIKRFDMPKEPLFRFLKEAKMLDVRSIAFIGEGENTLNPVLPEALSLCREIGLDASLATNGLLLRKDWLEPILSSTVWIRFNLSAATSDTFHRIHGINGKFFTKIIQNIEAAVKKKAALGLQTTIGLQMVVVKDNFQDIIPLARLGRELGVDYLVVKQCSDNYSRQLSSPVNTYQKLEETFREAETYSNSSYKVSIKWKKLQNLGKKGYDTCLGTPFLLAVSGNGRVFPCGHFFRIREAEFIMGNICKTSFQTLIKSQRYWDVQNRIKTLDIHKECYFNCRLHYINEFLWELHNPPQHINFI